MVHAIHFYDPDGYLRHIARIFKPAVAPLRRFSTEKKDTQNCPVVPLPSLHDLLAPLFPLSNLSHTPSVNFPSLSLDASSSLLPCPDSPFISSPPSASLPHFSSLLTLMKSSPEFGDDIS